MATIPFIFEGSMDAFRALNPTRLWGRWKGSEVGSAVVGVIDADSADVRSHSAQGMTLLPASGGSPLSDEHLAAFAALGAEVTAGDTLTQAVRKVYKKNGAHFLHPDRY